MNMSHNLVSHNLVPKAGDFYYHFKHNSKLSINNFAYKIIGLGTHTETDEIMVVYQPFYRESKVFENKVDFRIRPLSMFLENVEKPEINYFGPRFIPILDEKLIKELENTQQKNTK